MARGSHKHCGIRCVLPDVEQPHGRTAANSEYLMSVTWCGEKRLSRESDRALSLRLVTCTKCAAAIGKAKLAKLGRVTLERDPDGERWRYFRSAYRLLVDGEHRGWIACRNGWGEGWNLFALPGEYDGDRASTVLGYQHRPNHFNARASLERGETRDAWPVHYAARDAMACLALDLVAGGKLPTSEERTAAIARHKQERAEQQAESTRLAEERQAERARLEVIRLERVETWRAALEALDARADLSNLERAGLEAIKLLYPL